ncbi:MAG: hypothetical protein COA65_00670 [Rhodospirillaceae bacterium]|nr:MAG: hypothetical protein COA65_00670 [Rhodospirillaceae bacterium]
MIAKLERVPLREVWKHEAYDFTQWLEENIDILSEAIDLTLVNAEREKKTESSFSVDLVAEDESGATVIIENQLEKSNHDHLGKLITYLTAMQARTAIWIVSEPRPEHVAAIVWLNESSSADFYLLKIEAIRIGDSAPAPLLTVIVGPSEEGKSVGRRKQESGERYDIRHRFWSQLVQHPNAKLHKHITPGKYAWIGLGSGMRGVGFNYATTKEQSGAEVYIDRGKELRDENLAIFDQFHAKKDEIEKAFGGPLSWERLEGRRACQIRARVDGGYRNPEEQWNEIHGRMTDAMNRLVDTIRPQLRHLRIKSSLENVGSEGAKLSP